MKTILTLLLVVPAAGLYAQHAPANKTTAMPQRLIAKAHYQDTSSVNNPNVLVLLDSAWLTYSNERHSDFDPNTLDYFDLNKFAGNGALVNFFNTIAAPNNVDSGEAWPRVAFDTLFLFGTNPYYGTLPDQAEVCTYNTDGTYNDVSHWYFDRNGPSLSYRQILQYTAGRISRVYFLYLDSPSFYLSSARYLIRDASGNIITDSTMGYYQGSPSRPYDRTKYTYNATGQYLTRLRQHYSGIADSFVNDNRYTNTYYPDGRLHTSFVEYPNSSSGPLRPQFIDSFGYTSGVAGYTSFKQTYLNASGNPIGSYYLYTAHVNAVNQKDSITYLQANSNNPDKTLQVVIYNSYGNPESNNFYYYANGNLIHRWRYNYYYQLYNPTQILGPYSNSTASITVYPNPTTGAITLRYPDAKPGTPISVRITNASGQLVHSEAFSIRGTSQQILLGLETAPGTYYLSVYDVRGMLLCTKSVLKL